MEKERIREQLRLYGIPVVEADLPHIQKLLNKIKEAHVPVETCLNLHKEVPLVVVDPEVIQFD